ncbi:hypothetical protein CLTEP_23820 [Clostridium tepidiprofundi DSM 19306]|uniref:DNase/tRNase domain of colicin-like bacteriocin n=1 Tax=Clostridium tepidiprofundi DSM 19306 TaxID=1121338 RepID=A0A151AUQ6_9CLOT|nr:HNH endonuclease [Clostridium tepidiprofundi]KYH31386.1 hypothetical protein CLTEP_23820 [Clostridium tepidiprofundi DSM 19306]
MIESLAMASKEIANEKLYNSSLDLPKFINLIKSKQIINFEEADKPLYLNCRNENLEGQKHSETGVEFKRKTIELANEREVTGVFPEFDTPFEMKLDESLYQESDRKQFEACNEELKEVIQNNTDLRNKFTEEQIQQIIEKETPDGYTWHHNEEPGVMQLVDTEVHAKTGHTGGKFIWGGGSENR